MKKRWPVSFLNSFAKSFSWGDDCVWCLTLAIAISMGLAHSILVGLVDPLTEFSDRTVGAAVVAGIDAGRRTGAYVLCWVVMCCVTPCITALLMWFRRKVVEIGTPGGSASIREALLTLSSAAMVLQATRIIELGRTSDADLAISVLHYLLCLVAVLLVARRFRLLSRLCATEYLPSIHITVISVLLPGLCIFFGQLICTGGTSPERILETWWPHLSGFAAFWVVFAGLVRLRRRCSDPEMLSFEGCWGVTTLTVLLAVLVAPLINEVQYVFRAHGELNPYWLWLFVCASAPMWLKMFGRFGLLSTGAGCSRIVSTFIFPISLGAIVLFARHRHLTYVGYGDQFHTGEVLLPVQQFFSFSGIPFVDIFPTHGLSEWVDEVLYGLVNGYRLYETAAWKWMIPLSAILLSYRLVSELSSPLTAFVFLTLTPFSGLVGMIRTSFYSDYTYFLPCLLPIFSIVRIDSSVSAVRGGEGGAAEDTERALGGLRRGLGYHFLTCLLLSLWRIDFGLAVTLGSLPILAVLLLRSSTSSARIRSALGAHCLCAFLVMAGIILGAGFVAYRHGHNPLDLAAVMLQFLRYQAAIQSRATIVPERSELLAFIQYALLPASGLSCFALFWHRALTRSNESSSLSGLAALALASIVLSIRSTQRHALAEGLNLYLFPLVVYLVILQSRQIREWRHFLSAAFFGLTLVVAQQREIELPHLKKFTFKQWKRDEQRGFADDVHCRKVAKYISDNLRGGETFFDFSNFPLLYVLTDKKFPGFVIPNLYHSSERVQNEELRRLGNTNEQVGIPFVVFKRGGSADSIDGVPNEVRSYRIAEYIFSNYRPWKRIETYEVWLRKDRSDALPSPWPSFGFEALRYNLNMLPFLWGSADPLEARVNTPIVDTLIASPVEVSAAPHTVSLANPSLNGKPAYLHFRIAAGAPAQFNLEFRGAIRSSVSFTVNASAEAKDYLVRISTLWAWYADPVQEFALSSSKPVRVDRVFLRAGD